jgi:hypothetical protein
MNCLRSLRKVCVLGKNFLPNSTGKGQSLKQAILAQTKEPGLIRAPLFKKSSN